MAAGEQEGEIDIVTAAYSAIRGGKSNAARTDSVRSDFSASDARIKPQRKIPRGGGGWGGRSEEDRGCGRRRDGGRNALITDKAGS